MTLRNIIWAAFISAAVSLLVTLASLQVVFVDGSWSDLVSNPLFFISLLRPFASVFVASFLASMLTVWATSRNADQGAS